jgi:hypothetical protein
MSDSNAQIDVSKIAVKEFIDSCSVVFNDLARRLHTGPFQPFNSLEDIFAALQLINKEPYFKINVANVYFKTIHFLLSELMVRCSTHYRIVFGIAFLNADYCLPYRRGNCGGKRNLLY